MANKTKKTTQKNTPKALKVIVVGEGGQGIQTIAKVMSRAAFHKTYHATYIPNFGTEQRGGLSLAFVQVSPGIIVSPKFKTADLYIIVTNRNIDRTLRYIGRQTHVLYDKSLLKKSSIDKISKRTSNIVPIDAFEQATTQLTERSFNVILMGILTGIVDRNLKDGVISVMDTKFDKYYKKNKALKEMNHKAFDLGFSLTERK